MKTHYFATKGEPEGDFALWIEWAEGYLEKSNPFNEEFPKYEVGEHSWQWVLSR
ncbi:MAG: hypothetical protein U5P10_00075 [Spirochaetia bacterium]|nr:hypothetical protein [Spirochaetia bacterium]